MRATAPTESAKESQGTLPIGIGARIAPGPLPHHLRMRVRTGRFVVWMQADASALKGYIILTRTGEHSIMLARLG